MGQECIFEREDRRNVFVVRGRAVWEIGSDQTDEEESGAVRRERKFTIQARGRRDDAQREDWAIGSSGEDRGKYEQGDKGDAEQFEGPEADQAVETGEGWGGGRL